MKGIYISDGRYYKQLKAGTGRFSGMYLWQEVRKFPCLFIPARRKFWLDDYGFIPYHKK